ncbi:unnamed protein product, partial [Ectocarpus sp. 4 AP-2014]
GAAVAVSSCATRRPPMVCHVHTAAVSVAAVQVVASAGVPISFRVVVRRMGEVACARAHSGAAILVSSTPAVVHALAVEPGTSVVVHFVLHGHDRVVLQRARGADTVRGGGCRVRGGDDAEGRGMPRRKGAHVVRSLPAYDRIVGTVQAEVRGWGLTTGGNHPGQDPVRGAAEDHAERGREAAPLLLRRRGGGGHDLLGDRRAGGAEEGH